MWDERFARPGFHFGTEPADFLRREAPRLAPGASVLAVADGEGRNSVWLAGRGCRVTAFDFSAEGVAKARRLAAERGVAPAFHLADIAEWDWDAAEYDAVAAIFIQFAAPDQRAAIFAGMRRAVRPGGLILLHGYAPRQVDYATGGPPDPGNMYTTALLEDAFAGFDMLTPADYDARIDEGDGHSGRSALVDLVARRPDAV